MKATVTQARVLAKVPSKTNPAKSYEIRLGGDGVVYCTCRAWITNKFCKHLEEYHAGNQQALIARNLAVPAALHKDAMLKFFEDQVKNEKPIEKRDYITRIVEDGIIKGVWK